MTDVIHTPAAPVEPVASGGAGGDKKAETRARILAAATNLFRERGIDGVGVDAIMAAAGLTHGGFYGHFPSKEALAAAACGGSLARSAARWEAVVAEQPAAAARRRIVEAYLTPEAVTQGCLLPALGPDIARRPEARAEATAALQRMADVLERTRPTPAALPGLPALATMVGALLLARVAADPDLAAAILDAARAAVLADPDAAQG